jgi:branched-chain amino acid transport system substrate-binding protein
MCETARRRHVTLPRNLDGGSWPGGRPGELTKEAFMSKGVASLGKHLLGLALVLGLALGLCPGASAADPVKIGVLGPMSFTQGEGHWNGAVLGAEEINAAGGIKVGNVQRPIELVKVDTNEFLSIPDATNAAEMAVSRHKVDFLVGGFRTEAVQMMQDIAMDAKKVFIGCGAAHPELCTRVTKDYDRYKYWFRLDRKSVV